MAVRSAQRAFSGDCRDLVELVTDFLDGTLSPQVRQALEAHVALCPGCAEYLAQFRETIAAAGQVRPADLSPRTRQVLLDAFRDLLRQPG